MQQGHPAFVLVLFRTDEAAKDDGVAIFDGDLGRKRALVGVGNIAHAGNLGIAVDVVDFLLDIHHHQAVGIDKRRDVQRDADLQLVIGGTGAGANAAVVINAADIGHRAADKKLRFLGLRSLNARTLNDGNRTVRRRRLQGHVPGRADVSKVAQTARSDIPKNGG